MASKVMRCQQCGRRCRNVHGWNVELLQGVPQWVRCPSCQTPEQNAEAEINYALLRYEWTSDGRLLGTPRVFDEGAA